MQRTTTVHAGEGSPAPPVKGLRLFGRQRLFLFDDLIVGHTRQQALTIGRDESCDIWLSDPTVSAVHATIPLDAAARDPLVPSFVLRDCKSKNGLYMSTWSARGPFVRVQKVPLMLGLYVRIGAVVLVAVDRHGVCPIVASSEADLIAQARALYGSEQQAARFIGLPVRRVRRFFARICGREAKP